MTELDVKSFRVICWFQKFIFRVDPRWLHRKSLRQSLPMYAPNLHLHIEQFMLRKNWGLSKHLLPKEGWRTDKKWQEKQKELHPQHGPAVGRVMTKWPEHRHICLGTQKKSCSLEGLEGSHTICEGKWFLELKHLPYNRGTSKTISCTGGADKHHCWWLPAPATAHG